jgi:hypothetical protein
MKSLITVDNHQSSRRPVFPFRVASLIAILCLLPAPALAIPLSPVTIIESYYPEISTLEYTVHHAAFSPLAGIVSFAITTDPEAANVDIFLAMADNGWAAQTLSPSGWTDPMQDDAVFEGTYPLTWAEFYGVAWPFGDITTAAGYFVPYSDIGDGFYIFDNPALAITPGETLGGFEAVGVLIASDFIGGGIDPEESFAPGQLSAFEGASVPEPSTLALAVSAVLLLVFGWGRLARRA